MCSCPSVSDFFAGLSITHAKDSDHDLDVQALPFQQQAAQIRSDIAESERYAELTPENRDKVLDLLARMERLLDTAGNIDAMSMHSRVELFNGQEQINTILTGARADSRMVCRREVTTGSHCRQQTCMTIAERERRRQRDHENIQDKARWTPCLGVGGPGQCVGP